MISRIDVERLAKWRSDHGILSAYIPIDPRLRFVRQLAAAQFKGAVKAAERRIKDERWRDVLERESRKVVNFLVSKTERPRSRGIFLEARRNLGSFSVGRSGAELGRGRHHDKN
jgi:hypothetical protein